MVKQLQDRRLDRPPYLRKSMAYKAAEPLIGAASRPRRDRLALPAFCVVRFACERQHPS